jgi:hypothetical protein
MAFFNRSARLSARQESSSQADTNLSPGQKLLTISMALSALPVGLMATGDGIETRNELYLYFILIAAGHMLTGLVLTCVIADSLGQLSQRERTNRNVSGRPNVGPQSRRGTAHENQDTERRAEEIVRQARLAATSSGGDALSE